MAVGVSTVPPYSRRFWPLFMLGLLGIAVLPIVLAPLLKVHIAKGTVPNSPLYALVGLALIQPTLLLAAATAIGAACAHRVGFGSHIARVNVRQPFAKELPLAIGSGVIAGVLIVLADRWLFLPRLPEWASIESASRGNELGNFASGVLYGGITEELLMRWGLLSVVLWGAMRLFRPKAPRPTNALAVAGIILVAFVFAAGHLPAAATMAPLHAFSVSRLLMLNAAAGLLFGWLYWKRSLESAMVAHATVHGVFAVASALATA